jgi:two-component sensor histidine kinase
LLAYVYFNAGKRRNLPFSRCARGFPIREGEKDAPKAANSRGIAWAQGAAVGEEELLLKEIQHRVKNGLSLIAGGARFVLELGL